jgi:hypothetical protein
MKDEKPTVAERLLALLTEEFRSEFEPRLDEVDASVGPWDTLMQGLALIKQLVPDLERLVQTMGEEMMPGKGDDDLSAKRLFESMAASANRILSIELAARHMQKALLAACAISVIVEDELLTRNEARIARQKEGETWN